MRNVLLKWIKDFERPLIILSSSICLTLLLLNLDFNFLEANLYDIRVSHGYQSKPSSDIVIIALDDKTTKHFDDFAPLPLDFHTRLLEILESFEPKAVGYLIDMNHVDQVNPRLFKNEWGKRFIEAANRMRAKGTTFIMGTPFDVTGERLPPEPLNSLPHAVAVVHKDGNVFAEDKITRRALLTLYGKPAFHLELARSIARIPREKLPLGTFQLSDIDAQYFFFRYHQSTAITHKKMIDFAYRTFSFADILNRQIAPENFKNKIILVGPLSSDDSSDFALTPFSKASFTNPKLLVHANILDSILHLDGITRAPNALNGLVTFLVTTSVLWWIITSTPLYGVFATLTLALALIIISQAFFQIRGLWIRESQPLVGIFVSYYLAVPYRLIREYKKRWDYQKKNELLTQVEELKTNFLSLVTHDLKTPVARVQGLAEVLLRENLGRFSEREQENLRNIITSTEELNHFITSILELSKVESNHLHLNFVSKDVNQLIEYSIEGFRAHAHARQIEIVADLEPLFPIKVDASLISKVLNNLIDNAIKYSPPNSSILIQSREEDGWVIISVHDRGIGMTEKEQASLFTRFYRAKNDTTTSISGTGLGLYLTKYFIGAHQGRVEVVSQKDKGSTFKIFLPIQTHPPTIKENHYV